MKSTGISLGWNCSAAQDGLRMGLRGVKSDGYKTCPFDMMISNYFGMCECIKDDFKYFCDPKYLVLRDAPDMSMHFPNQKDGEKWIYNTYYNFTFNHESPYHGNLYLNEQWSSPHHFVNNNYENFIKRYEARIKAFRDYINSGEFINFVLWRYNAIPNELETIIKDKYPNLKFNINSIIDFGPHTLNALIKNNPEAAKLQEIDYLKYMNVTNSEYDRYYSENINKFDETNKDIKVTDNITLIEPKNNKFLNDPNYLR